MPVDVGQELVAAYHLYVANADFVHLNTALPTVQGDIDVIALSLKRHTAILCEVKTHIRGLGGEGGDEATKIEDQLRRAEEYARSELRDFSCTFEVWSPVVRPKPLGELERMASRFPVELVVNSVYASRVRELQDHAAKNSRKVENSAYRMLQILARLRS